jgi:hypothetical protein
VNPEPLEEAMAQTPKSTEGFDPGKHANGDMSHRHRPVDDVVRFARTLPRMARQNMSDRPEATVAAIAGGSFLLGVLLGSRVVRALLASIGPYALMRLARGEVGDKVGAYLEQLIHSLSDQAKGA